MNINEEIIEVCRLFGIEDEPYEIETMRDGHINTTYRVIFKSSNGLKKYLVQGINTHVFKNPDELMKNIVGVTTYLREKIKESGGNPDRETLTFLKSNDGNFYRYYNGKCWRIYNYIDNSHTINIIESPEVFENAGRSFGAFQKYLSGYPMEKLYDIIQDFHNTPKRLAALEASIAADVKGRAASVKDEIDFALSRKADTEVVLKLYEEGLIPLRVTHNDTKLNNILFDDDTNESICVIDLDTIMPGFSLYDFGDSIRFGGNTAAEDETDLSKVKISLPLFESYTKGFLSVCAEALTKTEVDYLAFSAKLMTLECGIRFLTDYLDGDVYFRTEHEGHNLERARNQFKLVSEIEKNFDAMNKIVADIYEASIK
ncbi:MAG: phosphotransferase enzyme family protein [Acutalibacteraceae bacterium]